VDAEGGLGIRNGVYYVDFARGFPIGFSFVFGLDYEVVMVEAFVTILCAVSLMTILYHQQCSFTTGNQ
jgi:hypothetical protein